MKDYSEKEKEKKGKIMVFDMYVMDMEGLLMAAVV